MVPTKILFRFILSNKIHETMKRSTQPTAYLLTKAYTTSEWDGVTHALIYLDNNTVGDAIQRMAMFEFCEKNLEKGLCSMEFLDSRATFLNLQEGEYDEELDDYLEEYAYCFVELNPEGEEAYTKPEAKLKTGTMWIGKYGEFTFNDTNSNVAGEDFWTDSIDPAELYRACFPNSIVNKTEVEQ